MRITKNIVLNKCVCSNKYVFLKNKFLLFISVYITSGVNVISAYYIWECRNVINIARGRDINRISGLCSKCESNLPHTSAHTREKPFTCTECGIEVYLLPRIRRDIREFKVLHVL